MKTAEEKLNLIYKGCDKIVDEYDYSEQDNFEDGRLELAKLILEIIEED